MTRMKTKTMITITNMKNGTIDMKEVAEKIIERLEQKRVRSAWNEGVRKYALWMMRNYEEWLEFDSTLPITKKTFLNGATTWAEASYGGCYLITDEEIARMLCNNTELKRTRNGALRPNKREEWLDVQARALYQSWLLIEDTYTNL